MVDTRQLVIIQRLFGQFLPPLFQRSLLSARCCVTFCKTPFSYRENAALTLLIQYIYCYPPYLEAALSIPNMKKCHIVVKK